MKRKNDRGSGRFVFGVRELIVTLVIVAALIWSGVAAYHWVEVRGKMTYDAVNVKQILLACRAYAADWDGAYPPAKDHIGSTGAVRTSTDVFDLLIPDYTDTEAIFWIYTSNPEKRRPPVEDGALHSEECSYSYVMGLTETSFSRSPLVLNEMVAPWTFGEHHPWLASKTVVVGYAGGQVVEERLNSDQPGATLRSLEEGAGEGSFDYSNIDPANILNP